MYKSFFLVLFFLNNLFGLVTISNEQKVVKNFNLPYLYDKSQKLSIDKISTTNFTKNTNSQFTHGYTMANVWYKITITNNSQEEDFIVYLTEPFFEKAELYYFDTNWKSYKSDLFIPLDKRVISDSNPAFPVHIKTNETKTYYLKTFSQLPNYGEIKIFEKESFILSDKLYFTIGYLYFFGGLTIIIVISLFLFITLKEKIYLYYTGYVFFYTLFVFIFSGLNLYVGLMPWHYELHLVAPLFIYFLIKFSMEFLNIEHYARNTFIILKYISYLYLLLAICLLFAIEPWYQVISSLSTIIFILLIYSVYKAWKGGHKKAQIYFIAISFYMFTIILLASMVNGWIENNDLNRYSFLFGSFIEMVFFTLILAGRFHDIKNEKIQLQRNMLKIKEKNQKILENKVKLRTKELETINQELLDKTKILQQTQTELETLNNNLETKVQHSLKDARKKDKMLQQQSRLAQMGEMISMIAHQWRQPLASIQSAILAIQTKQYTNQTDLSSAMQREEYLTYCNNKYENIKEYINFLSTTIDDFRGFFKPDKQMESVLVSIPIKSALKIIGNSLEHKSIKLNISYQTDKTITIYKNEMIQALLNIIKNSEDILIEKKIINPYINIDVYEEQEFVVIKISDNGGGISDTIINKIFDPYFSTKTEKNGTGLGLYMCKLIVEKHNKGIIDITNTNNGAAVYIKIKQGDNL